MNDVKEFEEHLLQLGKSTIGKVYKRKTRKGIELAQMNYAVEAWAEGKRVFLDRAEVEAKEIRCG